jgi:hypothetical protein
LCYNLSVHHITAYFIKIDTAFAFPTILKEES